MAEPIRAYWDACTWISLINKEAGRFDRCNEVIRRAQNGEFEIWTSALNLAEVYRKKCDGEPAGIDANDAEKIRAYEDYLQNEFIRTVQLDEDVGLLARDILRDDTNSLKMPNDAIHLATAAWHNIDEFHTFDEDHLLPLDNKIAPRQQNSSQRRQTTKDQRAPTRWPTFRGCKGKCNQRKNRNRGERRILNSRR